MKKLFLLIFFTGLISISAQELSMQQLDSLYNLFLELNRLPILQPDKPGEEPKAQKCGFGIVNQVKLNIEKFSPEQQVVLKKLLVRPQKHTSMVSPSGRFRIHYDTTGSEVPRYELSMTTSENVSQVGIALDSSYNFEVNYLGYLPPPQDNGEGGDNLYDIYITAAAGNYGFTQLETSLGNQKYTSFIEIHYEFKSGFATHGLEAMRVTIAHELHHAIQMGNYAYKDQDLFFHELTSTAMEEFVYDTVNDYYAYMPDYFNNPHRALANNNGYNLAVWNIFLRDKFDYDILKRQWELLPQMRALNAIAMSIYENGSNFTSKLNEFGIWTFFTSYRTIPGKYFEEAAFYPVVKPTGTFIFNSSPVNGQARPTSNNFITFINSTDSLTALITNADYLNAISNPGNNYDYEYILSGDSINGSVKLTDDYYAKFSLSHSSLWAVAEILNNQIVRLDSTIFPVDLQRENILAYPNPFFYNKTYSTDCNCIKIFIDSKGKPEADLNIYTSAMELVYSQKIPFDITGRVLNWDIRSESKNFASGVYLFTTKIGDEVSLGKLVIFNE